MILTSYRAASGREATCSANRRSNCRTLVRRSRPRYRRETRRASAETGLRPRRLHRAASWNSWAPTRSLISNIAVGTLCRGNGGDRSKATALALMNQSRSRLPYISRRAYRWKRRGSLTQEQNDAVNHTHNYFDSSIRWRRFLRWSSIPLLRWRS
jgi:hypothetical protein